jgi:hypothetical protein
MKEYKHLRTLAFQLRPGLSLQHQCEVMVFPDVWKEPLKELARATYSRHNRDQVMIPVDSLNRALIALTPDLIHIPRSALKRGNVWLYSDQQMNTESLLMIVKAWVNTAFAQAPDSSRQRVLQQMQADELHWQTTTLDLADWTVGENGTATPGDKAAFVLLPHYLATIISDVNTTFEIGNEQRKFRRAPRSVGQNGTELITWPPFIYHDKKGNEWPYSIMLTLTVQTMPFQSFPVVHCNLGIRRWVGTPDSLPGGLTTAYLLTETPWIRGFKHTHSFQCAPLAWKKDTTTGQFHVVWGKGGELAAILEYLTSHQRQQFPNPSAINNDPFKALNIGSSPNAAIVYHPRMKPGHGVGSGLTIADRQYLLEQLQALLATTLQLTDPPERVKYSRSQQDSKEEEDTVVQWRAAIADACNGGLVIEIRYQDSAFAETMLQVLREELDMPLNVGETCTTPEVAISVSTKPLGAIGDGLMLDRGRKNTQDQVVEAATMRMQAIQAELPPASSGIPTLTLIELANKDGFDKNCDPKRVLRSGFARSGRLTQFFTPEDEKNKDTLEHRARYGFRDGLRQLGVGIPGSVPKGLPELLNVIGVWFIRQNAPTNLLQGKTLLPVFVNVSMATGEIRATASGIYDSEGWLPYPAILRTIATGMVRSVEQPSDALPFVQQIIEQVTRQGDTLLLCHAQNFRQVWPWIQNGKITRDWVAFGNGSLQPITQWPGLRVIRIRSDQDNETPEWYAEKPESDEKGFSKGLFRMGERVFASTYQPAQSFSKKMPRALSKLTEWQDRSGNIHSPDPSKQAWNPGLFELTVAALQPGDTPERWAALVHELRNVAIQYNDATALPLPLHLAKQIGEYVLLTDEVEEEE